MLQVACPSCGAAVGFRSAASVMAVCTWCRSTLVRDADSVRDVGRMSEVLEDYSPIQLNTSGVVDGVGFTVVGRIQLRYENGYWNEWYVLDDAGRGGWLSDASGRYAFTREVEAPAGVSLPRFDAIAPGSVLDLGTASDGSRARFVAGDVRSARCTGGQGELPFQVGDGYTAYVADFRRGAEFVTLDYADEERVVPAGGKQASPAADASSTGRGTREDYASLPERPPLPTRGPASSPTVYRGRSVTLDSLRPQLLRDADTIADTAGRIKGRVSTLACPSCGASIAFVPGATTNLVCQTCHASVDVAGPTAEVLEAATRVEAVRTSLALGAVATIRATKHTIIGLVRRADAEGASWTEYLLHAPTQGFFWLVETDDGWERADVLDAWPYWLSADEALLDGTTYRKLYDYDAVVRYAAGAFNWRVSIGDTNEVTEFSDGAAKLAAEADRSELTWSRSTPVSPGELATWFGRDARPAALANGPPDLAGAPAGGFRRIAKWMTVLFVVVNIVPLLFSTRGSWFVSLLALAGLWVPAWIFDAKDKR